MIKAVIFDHDGAVVDLVPYHIKSWQRAFSLYDFELTPEEFNEKMDDYLREQSAKNVLPDVDDIIIQRLSDLKQVYYISDVTQRPPEVLPHFLEVVNNLRQHDYKIGVAGSSKNTYFILEQMGILSQFDAIIDRYDFVNPKPEPDIYNEAIKRLGCSPAECLIVDDSVRGVTAALKSGATVVGITTHSVLEQLQALKPHAVVDSLCEITPQFIMTLDSRV